MKTKWQYCVCLFAMMMILPGQALSAAKKPATMAELAMYKGADRQQILEEGAKKEGKLTFYTSGILKLAVNPVVDAFKKKYPFIKVDIWRASGDQLVSRAVEEFRFGKHLFDTMESTQTIVLLLQETGIMALFYSPNFPQLEEESLMKAAGGVYAAAFRSSGIGFGYNTNLLKKDQLPQTYQDLLDPKWKGKLAINGGGVGVNWAASIYRNFSEDLLKKIARQDFAVHMISAPAVLDQIINGEYPGSPTIVDSHVFESKKSGAPVAWAPMSWF